jgi:hypothetical protein
MTLPGSLLHYCPTVAKTLHDWIPFCCISRLTKCTNNAVCWILALASIALSIDIAVIGVNLASIVFVNDPSTNELPGS